MSIGMMLVIGGGVLILIAAACFSSALWADRKVGVMGSTATYSAADVAQLFRTGTRGRRVEISGVVECENPLSSPLSDTLCVAYLHQEVHHVQQGVYSDWQEQRRHQRDYTTIDPARERRTRFHVRDATGAVLVDPSWATLQMPRVREQFLSTTSGADSLRPETVGTWHTEDALPLGQRVYVLGYLGERDGEAVVSGHPTARDEPFLISHRSERELTRSASWRSNLLYMVGGAAGVLGALAAMLGLLRYGL